MRCGKVPLDEAGAVWALRHSQSIVLARRLCGILSHSPKEPAAALRGLLDTSLSRGSEATGSAGWC